jgi:hypothetical protein
MTLTQVSFAMFAATACGGLLLTLRIGLKKRYPLALAAGHGLLGLSAMVVLGYALSTSPTLVPAAGWWAACVLGSTWCGGILLFRVLRPLGRRLLLALIHGGLALVGLFLLYRFIY